MMRTLQTMWRNEEGVLSFEWTLLLTLLTIGVVAGLAATRDAIVDELGDAAQAMITVDDSYNIAPPLVVSIDPDAGGPNPPAETGSASGSAFRDRGVFTDFGRGSTIFEQSLEDDAVGGP